MSGPHITATEAWSTHAEAARALSEARVAQNKAWAELENKLRNRPGAPFDAERETWLAACKAAAECEVEAARTHGLYLASH